MNQGTDMQRQFKRDYTRPHYEPHELRDFWPDFTEWLSKEPNKKIYEQFVNMAKKIDQRGFMQYSGKTIVEAIRWHTNLREAEPTLLKISNNRTADMARLCMLENPQLNGLFRIQKRASREQ